MVEDGHVYVDGGLLAYIPLDGILPACHRGLSVASNLENVEIDVPFPDVEEYGTQISGWKQLWANLPSPSRTCASPASAASSSWARTWRRAGGRRYSSGCSAFTRSTKAASWWRLKLSQVVKVLVSVTRSTKSLPSRWSHSCCQVPAVRPCTTCSWD